MDTMANLLLILFCLTALYTALGLIAAVGEGLEGLPGWRPRRLEPGIDRRPRRARPRRRIERVGPGAARRAPIAAKAAALVSKAL
jgi:hypothetical protein